MKFRSILFFLIPLFFISCTDKQTKKEIINHQTQSNFNSYIIENQKIHQSKLTDYIKNMPLENKVAQLFIENLEGNTKFRTYENMKAITDKDDDEERPLVAGGYLFFSYNIADSVQAQKDFNNSINDFCRQNKIIPPYLAVDQEGGWVSRLKKLNTKLPSNQDVAKNNSIAQSYEIYREQALQMQSMGFHMNLAPVIEVCTPDNEDFLDGRSFGSFEQVLNYGRACVNAYENNQIATVVKHFPGNTNTDPHTGLPEIKLSEADLKESVRSFEEILKYNPSAILMSHARTSAIDPGVPACLSKVWVTDILRNTYKYQGIIFSDDIFMGALADNGYPPEKAALMAIDAGVDCIMISEKRFGKAARVIYKKAQEDSEFAKKIDQALLRILEYKEKAGLFVLE
ncbi:MAG: glycoside hydrolase family 3 protein [Treponema sp.]|nr:glycoside hydrolase family 3 protein [Treponema sp.]